MNLILLTHSREIQKPSNTGKLVQAVITQCKTIIWQRTQADESLLQLIQAGNTALIYPAEDTPCEAAELHHFEHFIIIDSTWQEARKIYNRSPYLQKLPRIQLFSKPSVYNLRRNQITGGLCTAECAIELLHAAQNSAQASELERAFHAFLTR
ncbi:Uncharacterized conserved protein YfiP, contains DTW domain [hydrothermal vent metagenome]|uniref:tRNA-uridine aminocarboxypropyltransferase n=1 Tax=hydrothermal vent metagenome TaxID=652676 RepID=A0A3B0XWE0_9ZZZZ